MPHRIGRGWVFPPQPDEQNSLGLTDLETEIRQSIFIILNTAPGERLMRPEFGCRIHEVIFSPANQTTAAQVEGYVKEALARWEPRITLAHVTVTPGAGELGTLFIAIEYQLKDDVDLRSLVYPFHLNPV